MSSILGNKLKMSIFGESHGTAIGVSIDGMPPGEKIDMDKLLSFMKRRSSSAKKLTTNRKEEDIPIFLSGILECKTTGFPICAIIENKDVRSSDYENLRDIPRPSHADYTAFEKYKGEADMRGGGHFSGRLTAPMCIAGGIAKQILERQNIFVGAHISQVGDIKDALFGINPTKEELLSPGTKFPSVIDNDKGEEMMTLIEEIAKELDSIGGVIECAVINLPVGLGSPIFQGIENRIAQGIFGIPGVKGIEFGSGFQGVVLKGSENNDDFTIKDSKVSTTTNNSGGINGGITNGMPLILRAAIKPTPSISRKQQSFSLSEGENKPLVIKGRHDPCIALRAVPVVEALCAFIILDILMEEGVIS